MAAQPAAGIALLFSPGRKGPGKRGQPLAWRRASFVEIKAVELRFLEVPVELLSGRAIFYMYDAKLLSELVGRIYEAAVNPSKWAEFLAAAAPMFASHVQTIHFQDTRSGAVGLGVTANMDEKEVDDYRTYYAALNPLMKRTDVQQEGRAYVRSELIDSAALEKTEWYDGWARPQKLHDCVCGTMFRQEAVCGNITFFRPKDVELSGAEEARTLQFLMPHLVRAMQIYRRLAGHENRFSAAAKALDLVQQPIFVLDRSGKVLLLNNAAERLLAQKDGLNITGGRLVAGRSSDSSMLSRCVQGAAACANSQLAAIPQTIVISRPSLRRPYVVFVAPLVRGAFSDFDFEQVTVGVFITDLDAGTRSMEDLLTQYYGLTPAETRLATALLAGESLTSAAESFGVSRNTVRSQLQSIFSKTDVRRQGELMRILTEMAQTPRKSGKSLLPNAA